jgi:predicted aconitase
MVRMIAGMAVMNMDALQRMTHVRKKSLGAGVANASAMILFAIRMMTAGMRVMNLFIATKMSVLKWKITSVNINVLTQRTHFTAHVTPDIS